MCVLRSLLHIDEPLDQRLFVPLYARPALLQLFFQLRRLHGLDLAIGQFFDLCVARREGKNKKCVARRKKKDKKKRK